MLDDTTPGVCSALVEPVRHLDPADVALVAPGEMPDLPHDDVWQVDAAGAETTIGDLLTPGSVVLSTGHHQRLGALAQRASDEVGAQFVTVQGGLITPHAPPLASGTTLLAWTGADADYWRSGRDDVAARVVGSQLLWDAATHPGEPPEPGTHPVWLGQLNGVDELPRRVLADTAEAFCKAERATYRPHPAERDRRSRATHRHLETEGIEVDRSTAALRELNAPVVSIFSTGVLEAATAGLPAWVYLPDPPPWVVELWSRYGLARWGDDPTDPAPRPSLEPARAVAHVVRELLAV
ncbi:MAG: RNA-binding protein [Ornithinibacter sp.]